MPTVCGTYEFFVAPCGGDHIVAQSSLAHRDCILRLFLRIWFHIGLHPIHLNQWLSEILNARRLFIRGCGCTVSSPHAFQCAEEFKVEYQTRTMDLFGCTRRELEEENKKLEHLVRLNLGLIMISGTSHGKASLYHIIEPSTICRVECNMELNDHLD